MKLSNYCVLSALALVEFALFTPIPAYAYIGPGAGITAIGTVIAILVAFLLAIVGFIWYPTKRALRKRVKSRKTRKK